jgi:hypothetical protein
MKRTTRRPKIEDLVATKPRPLAVEELVAVSGGLPDTGYICSAPSNDCIKE